MMERDPLREVLREWDGVEPTEGFDERVLRACSATRAPFWRRIWTMRVSVPVPVLAAVAMILLMLLLWPRNAPPALPVSNPSIVTQFDLSGFEPLPNGAARVISLRELKR